MPIQQEVTSIGSRGSYLALLNHMGGTESSSGWGRPKAILGQTDPSQVFQKDSNGKWLGDPVYVTDKDNWALLKTPDSTVTNGKISGSGGLNTSGDAGESIGRFQARFNGMFDTGIISAYHNDGYDSNSRPTELRNPYLIFTGLDSSGHLAWNPKVLSIMGIKLVKSGNNYTDIIESVHVGAAQTILNNQSITSASWNPTNNLLTGQSIMPYANEIIRIFTAGRSETDYTNITYEATKYNPYTPTEEQMKLALNIQYYTTATLLTSNYNRYIVYNDFEGGTTRYDTIKTEILGSRMIVLDATTAIYGTGGESGFNTNPNGVDDADTAFSFYLTESSIMAALQLRGQGDANAILNAMINAKTNNVNVDINIQNTVITVIYNAEHDAFTFSKAPSNFGPWNSTIFHYMGLYSGYETPVGQEYFADGTQNPNANTTDFRLNYGPAGSFTNSTGTDINPVLGDDTTNNGNPDSTLDDLHLTAEVNAYFQKPSTAIPGAKSTFYSNYLQHVTVNGTTDEGAIFANPVSSSFEPKSTTTGAATAQNDGGNTEVKKYNIAYSGLAEGTNTTLTITGNDTYFVQNADASSSSGPDIFDITYGTASNYKSGRTYNLGQAGTFNSWNALWNKLYLQYWDNSTSAWKYVKLFSDASTPTNELKTFASSQPTRGFNILADDPVANNTDPNSDNGFHYRIDSVTNISAIAPTSENAALLAGFQNVFAFQPPYVPNTDAGSGIIDASASTGQLAIQVDQSVSTVKLGSGKQYIEDSNEVNTKYVVDSDIQQDVDANTSNNAVYIGSFDLKEGGAGDKIDLSAFGQINKFAISQISFDSKSDTAAADIAANPNYHEEGANPVHPHYLQYSYTATIKFEVIDNGTTKYYSLNVGMNSDDDLLANIQTWLRDSIIGAIPSASSTSTMTPIFSGNLNSTFANFAADQETGISFKITDKSGIVSSTAPVPQTQAESYMMKAGSFWYDNRQIMLGGNGRFMFSSITKDPSASDAYIFNLKVKSGLNLSSKDSLTVALRDLDGLLPYDTDTTKDDFLVTPFTFTYGYRVLTNLRKQIEDKLKYSATSVDDDAKIAEANAKIASITTSTTTLYGQQGDAPIILINEDVNSKAITINTMKDSSNADIRWATGQNAWAVNAYTGDKVKLDNTYTKFQGYVDGGTGKATITLDGNNNVLALEDRVTSKLLTQNKMFDNVTTINAGAGNDIIDLSSTTYSLQNNTTVNGGDGNDIIWGGTLSNDSRNILNGDAGNDWIIGGNNSKGSQMYGGDGADTLVSGTGRDAMHGYEVINQDLYFDDGDIDIFKFNSIQDSLYKTNGSLNYDVISGYFTNQDQIHLNSEEFTNKDLLKTATGNILYYDADGDGIIDDNEFAVQITFMTMPGAVGNFDIPNDVVLF